MDFLEIRLLEFSVCAVPCNPDCLMIGAVAGGKRLADRRKVRSGRSISGANEALLREALDHHASATRCVKDVLKSNAAAEPDPDADGTNPDDPPGDGKSGRSISRANAALLREAMDHHASATKCIKDVLESNAASEPEPDEDGAGDDDPPDDGENHLDQAEKARQERRREARAIAVKGRSIAASLTSDGPAPTREQRLAEARGFRRAALDAIGK